MSFTWHIYVSSHPVSLIVSPDISYRCIFAISSPSTYNNTPTDSTTTYHLHSKHPYQCSLIHLSLLPYSKVKSQKSLLPIRFMSSFFNTPCHYAIFLNKNAWLPFIHHQHPQCLSFLHSFSSDTWTGIFIAQLQFMYHQSPSFQNTISSSALDHHPHRTSSIQHQVWLISTSPRPRSNPSLLLHIYSLPSFNLHIKTINSNL